MVLICIFLEASERESHSVMSNSLQPYGLYSPWGSPGQTTSAGSLSLLQGIFPTQGSNPGLLHCRQILHRVSHQGSPEASETAHFHISWPFGYSPLRTFKPLPIFCWVIKTILSSLLAVGKAYRGHLQCRGKEEWYCPRTKTAGRNVGGDKHERQSFWAVEMRFTLSSKAIDSRGEREPR